ncbi:MAG TPA: two-component regulator propeller domain-containing protein, partial [Puia sp.]
MRRVKAIIFSLLFCYPAMAQRMVFTHLNVENGLSQNSVLAIAQDGRGFMWFGNRYGLNRYDGHNFKLYKSTLADSTTLSGDYILSLFADGPQTLWVGTANGLNKYDAEKDCFERVVVNPAVPAGQDNNINCIYKDRKGSLWVGTTHGLFVRTGQKKGWDATPGIAGNNIRAIYEDHEGILWVGTTNGLTRI